jgi:hypothetical protein
MSHAEEAGVQWHQHTVLGEQGGLINGEAVGLEAASYVAALAAVVHHGDGMA